MNKGEKFYIVSEANVMANDTIGTQVYAFSGADAKGDAYNKLYRLWAYGEKPDAGETRQLLSSTLTEYTEDGKAIMRESKVFDFRLPPAPVYPDWIQPGEEDEGYMIGDRVHHNDKNWESAVDNNKSEPGVEGWSEL